MPNTIYAGGDLYDRPPMHAEYPAAADILPGRLVFVSSGEFAHAVTAGGGGNLHVARELYLQDVSDVIATGDTCAAYEPKPGERYWLRAATGQAFVKGVSGVTPNGTLGRVKVSSGSDVVWGYADETVTTTSNDQFVLVKKA